MNPQEAFLNLLIAAMMDAAQEGENTQLKTSIEVNGKPRYVRIIVIPEEMPHNWPKGAPAGKIASEGQ